MKQVLIYIGIFILAVAGVVIISYNKEPVADKAITISTYYSVMDPFQGMDVPIYMTNEKHVMSEPEAYQSIYLMNADESKKLNVSLKQITMDGESVYLGDTYTKMMFELDLPSLNEDYYIEDCFLDMTLQNGNRYVFEIGTFSYMYIEDSIENMHWTSLEANRQEDVLITRIYTIRVEFDELSQGIDQIKVGLNQVSRFEQADNFIDIHIEYEAQLLYGCPIVIHYINHQKQVIGYINYLRDTRTLQSAGPLNHVYELNNTF